LFITSCGTSHNSCELTDSCTIREPLARVNDSISGLLKSISIADLAEPAADASAARAQDLITIRM
jgi:DNA-binding IscR family transcriptional regulator